MSALAKLKEDTLEICASLILYGSDATEEIADAITKEINTMWNYPFVLCHIEELAYKVRFNVKTRVVDNSTIINLLLNNQSHELNFVRIEKDNLVKRSMMGYGLGQNSGHWLSTDQLGNSTTAAHEFGHALGLPHPQKMDYRGEGYPPLMAPRGTWVDAEFQWVKTAIAGENGGTMNPIYRRVHVSEIEQVLQNMVLLDAHTFTIGEVVNTYFDEKGNIIPLDVV